jgi:hypothetical protein
VKKAGQQAVGPTTDFAAHPLDTDSVVDCPGECPALVGAPADQRANGLAIGMGTAIRQGERTALRQECFDVFFDGTEKRLYNDHQLGTPPLVVELPSTEPRGEVSSFLLRVLAIILASVNSVKPDRSLGPRWSLLERSINVTSCLVLPKCPSDLIIYSGPKRPYSDHLLWPLTPEIALDCSINLVSILPVVRCFHLTIRRAIVGSASLPMNRPVPGS